MTPDQLKQLEQVLKENISISQHGYMNGLADLEGIEDAAKAIATFYEQSILPEVLKEKDEQIKSFEKAIREYSESYLKGIKCLEQENEALFKQGQTLEQSNSDLASQLSQLQSKMEEEKRKAFEAAREETVYPSTAKWRGGIGGQTLTSELTYPTYDDYLKSSTQSTESGNLNKQ